MQSAPSQMVVDVSDGNPQLVQLRGVLHSSCSETKEHAQSSRTQVGLLVAAPWVREADAQ